MPGCGGSWICRTSTSSASATAFASRADAGPRGNERYRRVLNELEAIHAKAPLDLILITGDMTDAGTSAEWAEFLDALAPIPSSPSAC